MAVYLIQAGNLPIVKIGKADNVTSRIRSLHAGHHETLHVLRTWPGDLPEESAMHRTFSEYRISRDWFRFAPAMLEADPASLLAPYMDLIKAAPFDSRFAFWTPEYTALHSEKMKLSWVRRRAAAEQTA